MGLSADTGSAAAQACPDMAEDTAADTPDIPALLDMPFHHSVLFFIYLFSHKKMRQNRSCLSHKSFAKVSTYFDYFPIHAPTYPLRSRYAYIHEFSTFFQ